MSRKTPPSNSLLQTSIEPLLPALLPAAGSPDNLFTGIASFIQAREVRIRQIQQSIKDGTYVIDPDRIAEIMLSRSRTVDVALFPRFF